MTSQILEYQSKLFLKTDATAPKCTTVTDNTNPLKEILELYFLKTKSFEQSGFYLITIPSVRACSAEKLERQPLIDL